MFCQVLLVLCAGISLFYAAPTTENDAEAKIIDYENSNDGSGNYYFRYVTSNGIKREETGTLLNRGQPDAYIKVEGFVSYTNSNGEPIFVMYSADKNGYHILPPDFGLAPPAFSAGVSPLITASLLGGG